MTEINANMRVQDSLLNFSPPSITDTSTTTNVFTLAAGDSTSIPFGSGIDSLFSAPMPGLLAPSYFDTKFIDTIFALFANPQISMGANPFGLGTFSGMPMEFEPMTFSAPKAPPVSWHAQTTDTPKLKDSSRTTSRMQATQYDEMIDKIAKEEGVDPKLIKAIIKQESGGDLKAISPVGAGGLMQLMPSTAKELGVKDRFDPEQNIRGGTKYIAQQLKTFNGDVKLALAAYNAGPGAVKKHGNTVPPYQETQKYVAKIMKNYEA